MAATVEGFRHVRQLPRCPHFQLLVGKVWSSPGVLQSSQPPPGGRNFRILGPHSGLIMNHPLVKVQKKSRDARKSHELSEIPTSTHHSSLRRAMNLRSSSMSSKIRTMRTASDGWHQSPCHGVAAVPFCHPSLHPASGLESSYLRSTTCKLKIRMPWPRFPSQTSHFLKLFMNNDIYCT